MRRLIFQVFEGAELPDLSGLRAQILGHYSAHDFGIPQSSLLTLRTAIKVQSGIDADLRVYPADHAFFDGKRQCHQPESADAAWRSTIDLLHQALGRVRPT